MSYALLLSALRGRSKSGEAAWMLHARVNARIEVWVACAMRRLYATLNLARI